MTAEGGPVRRSVVALSGGVGGAKLALGLSKVLDPGRLTIVGNTGDDFEHLGLHVSPDLDTVMYTLSGLANPETGWGLEGESWHFLEALGRLDGDTWFRLGDRDLATHVERTRQLRDGSPLSIVTAQLCGRLGVEPAVVPMSDDRVRTIVHTDEGALDFQHYFVREGCRPKVESFELDGIRSAEPARGFVRALRDPDLGAVVVCPSNPFVSIDPIFCLAGIEERLRSPEVPVIAVSPIVGGEALKGPAAKMMRELEMPSTAFEVARYYRDRGLLDGFVLDVVDKEERLGIEALGVKVRMTNTVMKDLEDRIRVARVCLDLARDLRHELEGEDR